MFLVDAGTPGMTVGRHTPTLDESLYGGHLEMEFDGCVVGDEAVLGEVDQGYRNAQVRLGPARMTHCMRWLGIVLLGRFLREVRPFRIYDGPSETHRWSIARRVVGRHTAAASA